MSAARRPWPISGNRCSRTKKSKVECEAVRPPTCVAVPFPLLNYIKNCCWQFVTHPDGPSFLGRGQLKQLKKDYDKTEDDLKSLQSVSQIIGEVLQHLREDHYIVKASSRPQYVVSCWTNLDPTKLTSGTCVVLDMTTLTIMRAFPHEVDPVVHAMGIEDPGKVSYSEVGGLGDQIRELREVIELPLISPELFTRVGIKAPKGVLLYGPPGTGKTLMARAIASNIEANFLKVVSSGIVDKYIGESARVIREMFGYAKDHQPCIIFMDEIDAIGGRRFSEVQYAGKRFTTREYMYACTRGAYARGAHKHVHACTHTGHIG